MSDHDGLDEVITMRGMRSPSPRSVSALVLALALRPCVGAWPPRKGQNSSHHQPGEQRAGPSPPCIGHDDVIQRQSVLRVITPLTCELNAGILRNERVDEVGAR